MNETSSEVQNTAMNDERRVIPYLGPIKHEPVVITISDEDSVDESDFGPDEDQIVEEGFEHGPADEGVPVEPEVVIPLEFLKLPENPRTLLVYLRGKKESFVSSIHSLGESFRPLLHHY